MSRRRILVLGIIVLTVTACSCPVFFPWSPICCWNDEIGLDTARARTTTYVLWMRVHMREEPTILSLTLEVPQTVSETRWRTVNTFSPGVSHSPHYDFHGALAQIADLEYCWVRNQYSPEARRLSAQALLDRWRSTDNYYSADKLLRSLKQISRDRAITNDEVRRQIESAG